MRADTGPGALRSVDLPGTASLTLASDPGSIRDGLRILFAMPVLAKLTDESLGAAEIVLAEVLNNIVEHAYAQFPGNIAIWITLRDSFLFVRTEDDGVPMPGGDLPGGKMACSADLPEGGFGWFLIRNLSHELTYQRDGERNLLSFCISVDYRG